jgi:hypothetical protein
MRHLEFDSENCHNLDTRMFGVVIDGVFHLSFDSEVKRMSSFFKDLVELRKLKEAIITKQKEEAFTKNKFEPTINKKSLQIAN